MKATIAKVLDTVVSHVRREITEIREIKVREPQPLIKEQK